MFSDLNWKGSRLGFWSVLDGKRSKAEQPPSHLLHHQEQCFGANMEVGLVNGAGILFPPLLPTSVASAVDGIWILWGWRVPLILLTHGSQHGSYWGPDRDGDCLCCLSLLETCSHCSRRILLFRGMAGKWQGLDKGRKVTTPENLSALVFHLPFLWCHFFPLLYWTDQEKGLLLKSPCRKELFFLVFELFSHLSSFLSGFLLFPFCLL